MFRLNGIAALTGLLVLAAALWGGWWWIAATAQKEGVLGWLESRRAAGWAAEVQDAAVSGFPNRVDLSLEELILSDPDAGWAWQAPLVQVLQLSYRPDRAIVAFPERQSFAAPGGRAELRSERLRASVAVAPETALRLRRAVLEGDGLSVEGVAAGGAAAWTVGAERILAALREAETPMPSDGPNAYDLSVTASQVRPPEALTGLMNLGEALPDVAAELLVDATLGFAQPLGLRAAEAGGARLTSVRVRPSKLAWGPLSLRVAGAVAVDAAGYPEGEMTVRAENWRAALKAAQASGALDANTAEAVRGALEVLSFLSGKGNGIEAPLRFAGGRVFIGPAPIGQAPRLTLPR
ncbi:DUF2125 domain-containing protein [Rhodovulum sp. DZ06]|uniref:DUF2125 domain-containing protein n=1 Tax=Rhodovulum sp. DZ06 TaxID=3425126 RepID=UPI003D3329EC